MPQSLTSFCLIASLLGPLAWNAGSVWALVQLNGQVFAAENNCEAFQSIRKQTNPGQVRLTPGNDYPVLGQNRDPASHYLIRIDQARPSDRWVAIDCGQLQPVDAATNEPIVPQLDPPEAHSEGPSSSELQTSELQTSELQTSELQTSKDEDFLLALSWQPSFCETRPSKPECISQTDDRFDAGHLVLHGLWPQPRSNVYCGVSDRLIQLDKDQRWFELPPLDLSPATRQALETRMPGMASGLHRHEWYKHGTCYSNSPEEYYRESIALLDQVNRSSVRSLLVNHIDAVLSEAEIRQQFNAAFGKGTGDRVALKCARDPDEEREIMVVELWLNLKGKIDVDTPIAELIQSAPKARRDCRQGEIDPAGFGNG